ncbi:MAG TPA: polysaccharide pyruvyl transferase family protein [Mycobacteriales bacterium]|nr:polysaccharide pyruvyl transferase family protein [Mycobacteriales bacterium]
MRRTADAGPVLLAGAFGQRNPGDEALLTAFHRALPDMELIVASSDPAQTSWRHGLASIDSRSPVAVARTVNACRAVVFAGGTVFKALPPASGRRSHELLRNGVALAGLARVRGATVSLVGVGVGDLAPPGCRPLARQLARTADLLILRDTESASRLVDIGVAPPLRVGADPAWTLLELAPDATPRTPQDRVAVVLSRWTTGPDTLAPLAAALRPLIADGLRVELHPWQLGGPGVDDGDLTAELASLLAGDATVVAPPADLLAAAERFRGARLVVTARFHALVAAAAVGTPSLALTAHEPKSAALAARLGQPAVRVHADPQRLTDQVRDALTAAPASAAGVRAEVAAADEAFGLLRLVLTGGSVPAEEISGLRLEPVA